MIEVIGAKLHCIKITESALDYHGSITIDSKILETADIPPGAFVYIWNKYSGARISTYTTPGPADSGTVCLNGAAARTCQVGDEVIIGLPEFIERNELILREVKVLTFKHTPHINTIGEIITYKWDAFGNFSIVPEDNPDCSKN